MMRYSLLMTLVASLSLTACCARQFSQMTLPEGVVGPESIAFDADGRGPYVGVSDGRILLHDETGVWTPFGVMPNWNPACLGPKNQALESFCGRPLGLQFHPKTHSLYVADAYHGLVEIDPQGGQGVSVAQMADGIPFKLTNGLDIDPTTGVIYFTDSSKIFGRWDYQKVIDYGDSTGRLMAYNPSDQTVRVLRDNLRFPSGVALSRNNDFLLYAETTTGQISKYWLTGPRSGQTDLLITLGGRPDNINRDSNGNFWIAQVKRPYSWFEDVGIPLNIDEEGHILERLDFQSGAVILSSSDVIEHNGQLYIGSLVNNYVDVEV